MRGVGRGWLLRKQGQGEVWDRADTEWYREAVREKAEGGMYLEMARDCAEEKHEV